MGKKKADRTIATLTAKLEKAEAKAERWKARAKQLDSEKRAAAKEAKRLRQQLEAYAGPAPEVAVSAEDVVEAPATEGTVPATATPDASWTVTRLRAAAREQGIAGYSRRSKAELLQLLTR